MADLTPEVFDALARLMTNDNLTDLTDEQLLNTLQLLRHRRRIEGRAAAELHRRDWTWPRIAAELGVDQSTVQKWASDYRQHDDEPDDPDQSS